MKWRVRLLNWASIATLLLPANVLVSAQPLHNVYISEVQTGSAGSTSQEFIELYNAGEGSIDLTGWVVEYFAAASSDFERPSRTVTLSGTIEPGTYYLLASRDYLTEEADQHFSYVLAKSGGHIRLLGTSVTAEGEANVEDLIGWGSALHPEGEAAPEPPVGSSLVRKADEQEALQDTDNNQQDFALSSTPTPGSQNVYPDEAAQPGRVDTVAPPEQEPTEVPSPIVPPGSSEETPVDEEQGNRLKPLQISELLPDPAAPQTDGEHEYIELHNPNPEPVDIEGYRLQSGNSFSYSYTFENATIAANSYQAFFVSQTGLTLANGGSRARLLDSAGVVVSDTAPYEDAEPGQSWMLVDATWQWSAAPSPGLANVVTLPVAAVAAATKTAAPKKTAKPAPKTAASKKPSTAKAKTASATKAAKTTKPASGSSERAEYQEPEEVSQVTPLHPGVLAAVGGLALLYGLYEYRQDIANRFYQLKRYRAARRTAGKPL